MNCADCASKLPEAKGNGRPRKYCFDCRPIRKPGINRREASVSCLNCGETFISSPQRGPISKYCSRKCREAEYHASLRVPPRPCAYCGAPVVRSVSSQRYCNPDCREAAKRKRVRERVGDPYPVDCHFCGTEFVVDPIKRHNQYEPKYCSVRCCRQSGRDQRRAKVREVRFERIDRHVVFERDGYVCGICGEPVDRTLRWPDNGSASLDHVVPISRGGDHIYDNVQCAHLLCNLEKAAKLPYEKAS